MDNILDPTSVDADHEYDCLECLSAKIMNEPVHCDGDAPCFEAADSHEDVNLVANTFFSLEDENSFILEPTKRLSLPPKLKKLGDIILRKESALTPATTHNVKVCTESCVRSSFSRLDSSETLQIGRFSTPSIHKLQFSPTNLDWSLVWATLC
jgi:hypothetical protein